MRKWLWIGTASVVLGGAGVFWYLDAARWFETATTVEVASRATTSTTTDESEPSDVFEPLPVEGFEPFLSQQSDGGTSQAPMARVVLEPGTQQPPRPDAESGKILRMPYADEEELPDPSANPWLLLLQRLNIFGRILETTPAEESESKEAASLPANPEPTNPAPDPATDYHRQHQHCPYTGGCPYPYSR
jgi:hypothetical protein